jgi:hypothetical protein
LALFTLAGILAVAFVVEGILVTAILIIDAVVDAVVRLGEVAVVASGLICRLLRFEGPDRI